MDIFEFEDYRDFIKFWMQTQPRKGRGLQAKLADAAGVQATFMSLVLNKKAHPSAEQAYALSEFMSLSSIESEYLQIQVQLERAGTQNFKGYLIEKKAEIKRQAKKISQHLEAQNAPAELDVQKYFSSWIYPAVHLLALIPSYSLAQPMALKLRLDKYVVEEALDFLTRSGILCFEDGEYKTSKLRLHAEKGSPQLMGYQMTTRARAAQKIAEQSEDLHFTSIHSASREDFEKLKNDILALIRKSDRRIAQSEEEEVYGFSIDLFQI